MDSGLCEEVLSFGWILFCSVFGSLCSWMLYTYMHTYMHLGSWIFCVGSYLYSYWKSLGLEVLQVGWIFFCSVLGLCAVGCYVHTYMHTYMHLGSWIFCVGSYLYSYVAVIDVVNIGSFLHHVGSYQSHCIGIGSLIVAAIGLKNSFLNGCISFPKMAQM